jgi:signal transduction histidine kinase
MNPLALIPETYRLAVAVAVIVLACLAIFALGWSNGASRVQSRWDKASAVQQQAALVAEQAARTAEQAMNQKLQEAENAATEREKKLRADYAAVSSAAHGLRDTVAALRNQLSAATAEARRTTADAALAVLGECADRYRTVAEAADGHASDVRTLTEAWPR